MTVDNISRIITEDEESVLIRHLPSLAYSSLFSLISFLKIIQLNREYRFSIIHAQDANYCAMSAIMASKLMRIPVVLHIHGINMGVIRLSIRHRWLEKSIIARLYRAYYLFLQKELIKRSNCVICVSESDKKHLPEGEKIVIPMGINTASFQATQNSTSLHKELRIPNDAFILGYVGALSPGKGLKVLLKAFHHLLKEMPQDVPTYLLIIGDGPEKRSLEHLADELGIRQYVRLTGFRTDVAGLLNIIDVFVFPSESEGSPIAILEAMAAGKPIIASNISSIREIVKHGEEAVLVSPLSVKELKRAILFLYDNSDLRVKLGKRAKERVEPYDVERVYNKIIDIYDKLTRQKVK